MEVRLLNGNEIQWAAQTAHEIFESCSRTYIKSQEEISQHYAYVRPEILWKEQSEGRLILWGAFEDDKMCGVAAMQRVGHITMLYVKPDYQRRGLGKWLLSEMQGFADHVLQLPRITVNVTPVFYAPFFCNRGFQRIQGMPFDAPFVSLEYPFSNFMKRKMEQNDKPQGQNFSSPTDAAKPEEIYLRKKVPKKILILLTAITFLACSTIGVIMTILYLLY